MFFNLGPICVMAKNNDHSLEVRELGNLLLVEFDLLISV